MRAALGVTLLVTCGCSSQSLITSQSGAGHGGAPSLGAAGASSMTPAGGMSNPDITNVPPSPCTTMVSDWCVYLGTRQQLGVYSIALDSAGNVLLAGEEYTELGANGTNVTLAKFTPDGQLVWTHPFSYSSEGSDQAEDIAIDANDNLFVVGSTIQQSGFGYASLAKLSSEGDVLWLRVLLEDGSAMGVATDAEGNAVIVTQQGGVSKYSPSGDLLWTKAREEANYGRDIAVDAAGNVFVLLGMFSPTLATWFELSADGDLIQERSLEAAVPYPYRFALEPSGDLLMLGQDAAFDTVLSRHSANGNAVWTNVLSALLPDSLALDDAGNIFVVGAATASHLNFDSVLAKYDPGGNLLWGESLGQDGGFLPRDVAVSAEGTVFVAGAAEWGAFLLRVSPP